MSECLVGGWWVGTGYMVDHSILISPLVVGDECKHTFYIDWEISPHTPTAITHPLILTKTANIDAKRLGCVSQY